MDEMRDIVSATPILSGKALARAERAMAALKPAKAFVVAEAQARVDAAVSRVV
jgi:beta-N-acetylhexosaminidase